MEVAPILTQQIQNRPLKNSQASQISFKSYFEDFNHKFNPLKSLLKRETDEFISTGSNVTKLGEGIGGETFKFNHPKLAHIVIKKNKAEDAMMRRTGGHRRVPREGRSGGQHRH